MFRVFKKIPYDVYPIVGLVSGALVGATAFGSHKVCRDQTVSTKVRKNHMTGIYDINHRE